MKTFMEEYGLMVTYLCLMLVFIGVLGAVLIKVSI